MAHSEFYSRWCFFKLLVTLGFHSSLTGDDDGLPVAWADGYQCGLALHL